MDDRIIVVLFMACIFTINVITIVISVIWYSSSNSVSNILRRERIERVNAAWDTVYGQASSEVSTTDAGSSVGIAGQEDEAGIVVSRIQVLTTAPPGVSGNGATPKVNYEARAAEAHCFWACSFRIEAFGNAGILAVAISRLVPSPLLLW
ncbi:hypothetical protein LTR37_019300 [Vermiconidia calcicola]|uniref:Uncharacterized protein n=1 Tax=Vermiconidia calcicola TaxID=1690605 RepID=A0ACC3MFP3_9PEZI|nr:hypothetical protein LTR37_019300 [Vermiconidia calcicola]